MRLIRTYIVAVVIMAVIGAVGFAYMVIEFLNHLGMAE